MSVIKTFLSPIFLFFLSSNIKNFRKAFSPFPVQEPKRVKNINGKWKKLTVSYALVGFGKCGKNKNNLHFYRSSCFFIFLHFYISFLSILFLWVVWSFWHFEHISSSSSTPRKLFLKKTMFYYRASEVSSCVWFFVLLIFFIVLANGRVSSLL